MFSQGRIEISWLFAIVATLAVTKVIFYIGGASTIREEATILSLILDLHMNLEGRLRKKEQWIASSKYSWMSFKQDWMFGQWLKEIMWRCNMRERIVASYLMAVAHQCKRSPCSQPMLQQWQKVILSQSFPMKSYSRTLQTKCQKSGLLSIVVSKSGHYKLL